MRMDVVYEDVGSSSLNFDGSNAVDTQESNKIVKARNPKHCRERSIEKDTVGLNIDDLNPLRDMRYETTLRAAQVPPKFSSKSKHPNVGSSPRYTPKCKILEKIKSCRKHPPRNSKKKGDS